MLDFLFMGGYWFFVWGSYLVTAAVLGLMFWLPRHRLRRLLRRGRDL